MEKPVPEDSKRITSRRTQQTSNSAQFSNAPGHLPALSKSASFPARPDSQLRFQSCLLGLGCSSNQVGWYIVCGHKAAHQDRRGDSPMKTRTSLWTVLTLCLAIVFAVSPVMAQSNPVCSASCGRQGLVLSAGQQRGAEGGRPDGSPHRRQVYRTGVHRIVKAWFCRPLP